MHKNVLFFVGWFFLINLPLTLVAQVDYPNHKQLTERLNNISRDYPGLVTKESLAKTDGGKDIWLVTIGRGTVTERPAIAIVGGIGGDLILGTELATQFIEKLLAKANSDQRTSALLDSITFYVFPDMSPDAREQYVAPLQYERFGNANPADHDRDGRIGEDPYDDLNNDGMITLIRVEDPNGKWMKHPGDERIMVEARKEKGEHGNYLVYSEGVDNDKDGQFNEDGEEGVIFNKNFSFQYPAFTAGAGEHAVSEIESRAIADFLFAAKNVFTVISFGPANNLSEPLSFNERNASGRIPTGWLENDIKINQLLSLDYNSHMKSGILNEDTDINDQNTADDHRNENQDDTEKSDSSSETSKPLIERLDLSNGKGIPGSNGDFFQWVYFHYGRFSFSTPGWWIPASAKDTPSEKDGRPGKDQYLSPEVEFLKWAERENIEDLFVPWTPVNHPDFQDRQVEVGGIKPFVMKNPPYELVGTLADKHLTFILNLVSKRPVTDIINIKTESLGKDLFRISAMIVNKGSFPTVSQMGQRNRWVQKTVLKINPSQNQQLISGKMTEVVSVIEGHSKLERSWLIRGKGKMIIRAGSENTGFSEISVNL